MCLLHLTVKVIMRDRQRRLNYLRGKQLGDYLRFTAECSPAELRDHRNLQSQNRRARSRDRQKPLPDPRNPIYAVHVCPPVD
jgi:hypothetical protein